MKILEVVGFKEIWGSFVVNDCIKLFSYLLNVHKYNKETVDKLITEAIF